MFTIKAKNLCSSKRDHLESKTSSDRHGIEWDSTTECAYSRSDTELTFLEQTTQASNTK